MRVGKQITKVSTAVVNGIKLLADRDAALEVWHDWQLHRGRMVIGQGPLTGLSYEVVEVTKQAQTAVRVDMLSRSLLINLLNEY